MATSRFAVNLRAARTALGISQESAARSVGTAMNTWARWERGLHEPDLPMLRRVAAALGTTAAALLDEAALTSMTGRKTA